MTSALCDRTVREPMAAEHFHRLFGGGVKGFVAVGVGHRPFYDTNGKYRYGNFHEKFCSWPGQYDQLVRVVIDRAASGDDIFVAPLLRDKASRNKEESAALPGRWLYVDVDGDWTERRAVAAGRLGGGVIVVRSGHGRHLYVPLTERQPAERIEALNRRLCALLADPSGRAEKWEANAYLRPPGTFNWKNWAADHTRPPTPVEVDG